MSTPAISIIVPVYKVENYLCRCLDSIMNQTFKNWECILVDDGSPDNSGRICDEYAEMDNRFKVFHQVNAGVSAARNKGLDEAQGKWIGFVDSDDWIEPEMYSFLYSNAIEKNADVVICGFVGQHTQRIAKICNSEQARQLIFTRKGFGGFSVTRLIATEKVKTIRFDTQMTYLEDMKFFNEAFKNCNRIYWNNKPLYNYFQRDDSVTNKYGLTEDVRTAFLYLDNLITIESHPQIKKSIILSKMNMCLNIALMYIKNNDLKNSSFSYLSTQLRQNLNHIIFTQEFSFKRKLLAIAISNLQLSKLLSNYMNR